MGSHRGEGALAGPAQAAALVAAPLVLLRNDELCRWESAFFGETIGQVRKAMAEGGVGPRRAACGSVIACGMCAHN